MPARRPRPTRAASFIACRTWGSACRSVRSTILRVCLSSFLSRARASPRALRVSTSSFLSCLTSAFHWLSRPAIDASLLGAACLDYAVIVATAPARLEPQVARTRCAWLRHARSTVLLRYTDCRERRDPGQRCRARSRVRAHRPRGARLGTRGPEREQGGDEDRFAGGSRGDRGAPGAGA